MAWPLRSSTSAAEAIFLSPLNAGLKARTTRTSGYTNPGTALANVNTNGYKARLPISALAERGGVRADGKNPQKD
jgi:flagellar basal body rod protein FlgG